MKKSLLRLHVDVVYIDWPMKRWLEYTMYVSMKINFRHGCFVYIKLYVCYDSHFKEDLDFMETKNISVQLW
jgi:hypothetical protein